METRFIVNGMSCESCSNVIKKTLIELDYITSVSINIITKEMIISSDSVLDVELISKKVKSLGFSIKESKNHIKRNLIISVILLVILFILANSMMFKIPIPSFLKNYYVNSITQLFLCLFIILLNFKFYKTGFKGLMKKAPNMDTLIMVSSASGFIFGLVLILLKLFNYQMKSELDFLYFESAAMIIVLVSVGKFIESKAIDKTTKSIKDLLKLMPKNATIYDQTTLKETEILISDIKKDDILIVKAGNIIPVDGVIVSGASSIDESLMSGEPGYLGKTVNDVVYKATVCIDGHIVIKASKNSSDCLYDEVINLINNACSNKAKIGMLADKVCRFFVPGIMLLSLLTFIIWLLITFNFALSFNYSLTVLVISCPCALGLATPVAITTSTGVSFKNYSLIKKASIIESLAKTKYFLCDKTGTITHGVMEVVSINPHNITKELFLSLVVSIEKLSIHPLSKEVSKLDATLLEVTDFKNIPTKGISGYIENKFIVGGEYQFLKELGIEVNSVSNNYKNVYFAYDNKYIGYISFNDVIKDSSYKAISELKKMHIKTVLISGDSVSKTEEVSKNLGFDEFYGEVLPAGKNDIVSDYQKNGIVLFVGDGINDSVAITNASISMAIGSGAEVAIDNADVILKRNNLLDAVNTIKLSKVTLKIIKQNLFFAFFYNICLIPIAMGVLTPLNIYMKPAYGAIAMSLSSLFVVFNALRINLFKYEE